MTKRCIVCGAGVTNSERDWAEFPQDAEERTRYWFCKRHSPGISGARAYQDGEATVYEWPEAHVYVIRRKIWLTPGCVPPLRIWP